MARGFESKDVEFQQEQLRAKPAFRKALTPDEVARQSHRDGISLSLARLRAELLASTHPHHRSALEGSIAALEAQLSALDAS